MIDFENTRRLYLRLYRSFKQFHTEFHTLWKAFLPHPAQEATPSVFGIDFPAEGDEEGALGALDGRCLPVLLTADLVGELKNDEEDRASGL